MSETLKPCPFCGGSEYTRFFRQDKGHCFDVDYHRYVNVDGIRQMICVNCGARGPESTRDREHCREKWNTRADENRWRSVAEQALAAIDYKRRDWLTEETDNNNIVVGCDRKKFLEALAAFDSLRKEGE